MIRVDLGRSGGQKKKGKLGKVLSLGSGKGGKKGRFGKIGGSISRLGGSAKNLIIAGLATAVAYLPHLFFEQYKTYVVEQQKIRVSEKKEKIKILSQEIKKFSKYKKELDSYESQKQQVKMKINTVRNLLAKRGTPVKVLDVVSQSLPKEAWVTKLDLRIEGTPRISINGRAVTNESVSDYVDKLKESVFIGNVNLESVNSVTENKVEIRSFSLNATPKVPKIIPVGDSKSTK